MKKVLILMIPMVLIFSSLFNRPALTQSREHDEEKISRFGTNPLEAGAITKGSTGTITPKITYHGGPLIETPVIYYIWYGNWNQANNSDTPSGQQILRDFALTIGNSPYFSINTTYSASTYAITGAVGYGGDTTDAYSRGTRLRDSDITAIVNSAITSGRLPYDQYGVYFVLTSSDVSETSGFCNKYCGWHTSTRYNSSSRLRYSFVGNANRCLNSCAAQTVGPNGNAGVDAMVSIIAHELEESLSDPDPSSGWVDSKGAENGDKCAWTFGQNLLTAPNGATYNITLGTGTPRQRNYLVQRNLKQNANGDTCNIDLTNQ